jgi:flagellar assembly factor FliW
MLFFAIVTIPEDHKKMSANLQGPVIINREKRIGKQFISTNPDWKTRHYILDELSDKGGR